MGDRVTREQCSKIEGQHTFRIRQDATGTDFLFVEREPIMARAMIRLLETNTLRFFGGFGT